MATRKNSATLTIRHAPDVRCLVSSFASAYSDEVLELPLKVEDSNMSGQNEFLIFIVISSIEYLDCGREIQFKGTDHNNTKYKGRCNSNSLIGGTMSII